MLCLTWGDPLSLNGELLRKCWNDIEDTFARHMPVVLVGPPKQCQAPWGLGKELSRSVKVWPGKGTNQPGMYLCASFDPTLEGFYPESLHPATRGRMAMDALYRVGDMTRCANDWKMPLCVITMPVDKHACSLVHGGFQGQTEFFEDLWQGHATMVLSGAKLHVGLATNHLPLHQVVDRLTPELIVGKAQALALGLQGGLLMPTHGITQWHVGICGVNPHGGDQGLFGDEEVRILAPALEALRVWGQAHDLHIHGPLSADTAFFQALEGRYHGILAMYHDQGLGPFKTIHFYDGVNLSLGLRHLRMSPDHGTGRELFMQDKGNPASLRSCLDKALGYNHLLHIHKEQAREKGTCPAPSLQGLVFG